MTMVDVLKVRYELDDQRLQQGLARMKSLNQTANQAMVAAMARTEDSVSRVAVAATKFELKASTALNNMGKSFTDVRQGALKMSAEVSQALERMAANASTQKLKNDLDELIDKQLQFGRMGHIEPRNLPGLGGISWGKDPFKPITDGADKMGKAIQNSQRGFAAFGDGLSRHRHQVQNTAFQLQDFVVQLQSGTKASVAFAQQAPQLLGGFGPLGAVLGLVAALAVPVGAALFSIGKEAEDAGKKIDDLRKALSAYKSAIDAALAPMDDLWKKFGQGATAAQDTYKALLEIERIKYLRDMQEAVGALVDKMEKLSSAVDDWQAATTLPEWMRQEAIAGAATAAANLQKQFGLTVVEANRIAIALQAMEAAKDAGPAAMAAAARVLAEQLMAAYEAGGRANRELLDAAESAYQLSVNAQEAAHLMGDAADGTKSAADAALDATNETAGWAKRLADVRTEINAIASALSQMGGGLISNAAKFTELNALKAGKSVGEAIRARQQSQMEAEFAAREMVAGTWAEKMLIRGERALAEQGLALDAQLDAAREASREAAKLSGGGGKGGGRALREEPGLFENIDREIQSIQREITLIGKSTAEVAKARAEWAMLDEAKKRGIKVSDELRGKIEAEAAQVGRLTEELERGEVAQQQFEQAVDGIADALAGALVAGESLRDGLAQVFKQIAADLIQSGIHRMIGSLFLGGGGGLGFLGALLPGRASGGPVRAGQPYMVGERGPEPFVPAVDGRILSVSQAQAALRGGAGAGGTVRVIIEEAPGFAARVRTEAQGVAVSVVAGTTRRQSDRQYLGGAR